MLLEEVSSKYSGQLQVLKTFPWSKPYISTGFLTQSGGLVHDVWKPIIKQLASSYKLKANSYLILGLAGGTLAKLIHKSNPNAQITGVEIDSAMIYLGKKYLDLDKIPNLNIINQDANDLKLKASSYDVIFVDLYQNDQIPKFVYTRKFLAKLFKPGKLVIFNHLFYDDNKKAQAQVLIKLLESCVNRVTLKRVLTNILIIASC